MKDVYEKPEIIVIEFDSQDVITGSPTETPEIPISGNNP